MENKLENWVKKPSLTIEEACLLVFRIDPATVQEFMQEQKFGTLSPQPHVLALIEEAYRSIPVGSLKAERINNKYYVTPKSFQKWLDSLNPKVKMRGRPSRIPEINEEIIRRHKTGESKREWREECKYLATSFKYTYEAIKNIYQRKRHEELLVKFPKNSRH